MNLTKNIITRDEAVAISPDYVAFVEGNFDLWDKINAQFAAAKRGQKAISAVTGRRGEIVFVKVKISNIATNDPHAEDGPIVRVSNDEFSWRVDGDKYAFLLPK